MERKIFINCKSILQVRNEQVNRVRAEEMSIVPQIENGYMIVSGQVIEKVGSMSSLDKELSSFSEVIDVTGRYIMPTWCDSHTHIVYAESREEEFVGRIKGLSYQEIADQGGGILNSAKKLRTKTLRELVSSSQERVNKVIQMGTGALEIKSGYGLTMDAELKMLRVVKALKEQNNIQIKSTFLGAHAIPSEYKNDRSGYLDLLINEMLPAIQEENLADYIDVFCETNYFTPEETSKILDAGLKYGLKPKIHVNQFTTIGGVKVGVDKNALSVDHLEVMDTIDYEILKSTTTIPTLLPSCSFFINIPFAPAKKFIENGISFALASDYNPGSTPSGNMVFVQSLGCIKMGLLPEQVFNASTINGAYAMELTEKVGAITKGKLANFIITEKIPSLSYLYYSFGEQNIYKVFINGKETF